MKDILKGIWLVMVLFCVPLLTAGLFAFPVYLLHQYHFLSIAIYGGEITGALFLMYWKRSSVNFGSALRCSRSDMFWCAGYIVLRTLAWLLLVPIVRIQTNWFLLLEQSLFYLLLNVPGEELHFRGLLFSSTCTFFPRKLSLSRRMLVAAGISSLLFGLLHFFTTPSVMWFLVFTADGLAFCALRMRSAGTFTPMMAHGLVNILTGAVLISAETVADNVALIYQVTLIILDLLFFLIVISQSQKQRQNALVPEYQAALE